MGELQEILGEDRVEGLIYYDGELKLIRTPVLVLATGGAASMFVTHFQPS